MKEPGHVPTILGSPAEACQPRAGQMFSDCYLAATCLLAARVPTARMALVAWAAWQVTAPRTAAVRAAPAADGGDVCVLLREI
jgi:hypothetical protein